MWYVAPNLAFRLVCLWDKINAHIFEESSSSKKQCCPALVLLGSAITKLCNKTNWSSKIYCQTTGCSKFCYKL